MTVWEEMGFENAQILQNMLDSEGFKILLNLLESQLAVDTECLKAPSNDVEIDLHDLARWRGQAAVIDSLKEMPIVVSKFLKENVNDVLERALHSHGSWLGGEGQLDLFKKPLPYRNIE